MERKLSDVRRIFLGLLLCAVVFSLHFGGEDAQASIRCAYIYSADSTTASDFRSFLLFHGFGCETTLIPSDSISEGANLSYFDLIIVGADTGGLVLDCPTFAEVCFWIPVWPNSSLVVNSGKPVLGLGIGGARFFEQLEGLAVIPYSNIARFENVQFFYPPNPAHQIFTTPYTVIIDDDTGAVAIYNPLDVLPKVYGAIDPGSGIPPGASLLGKIQVGDASYYPLVQEDTKYFLWGMEGSPSTLTDNSGNLLVNVINYLAKLAPAPTGAPKLDSPTDGMTGVPVVPTMAWNASAGATRYGLEIATDPAFIDGVVLSRSGIAGTSYNTGNSEVWLESDTVYYWRVRAENASGTSDWSDVWSFVTEAPYGNLFESVRGIIDPDTDGDGLDDCIHENRFDNTACPGGQHLFGTDYLKKTLFVRPLKEIPNSLNLEYWEGFKTLFADPSNRPGYAFIPALDQAGIEVLVIGDPTNPYAPMRNVNYDPSSDTNYPNVDIMTVIYKWVSQFCPAGNHSQGHIYFDTTGAAPTWFWDTKGYTPSLRTKFGYRTPEIFPVPQINYFSEGAYGSLTDGSACSGTGCAPGLGSLSPLNIVVGAGGSLLPPDGQSGTVELNQFTFDQNGTIVYAPPVLPATGYDFDTVLKRTIIHEKGHGLLEGLEADHCADPRCIMYSSTKDWENYNFGVGSTGNSLGCTHSPGGSKDIRLLVHNSPQTLNPPALSAPLNNATNVGSLVTAGGKTTVSVPVSWNSVTGAAASNPYEVQYSKVSTFGNGKNDGTVTKQAASASFSLTGLPKNTKHYWRVRVKNSAGVFSGWSEIRNFTTRS